MKYLSGIIFCCSLILFFSVYVSPEYFPYVGLLPFFIPVIWLINLFLLFILTLSWKRTALLHLAALIIGYKFALITFQIHPKKENAEGLKVLSYNAHLFDYKRTEEGKFDPNVFTWLQEHPADIKVFQEFYQDYTSASRNAVKLLGKDSDFETSYQVIEGNPEKRSYGLAIFSRYPIIHEGKVFDKSGTNGAIFADILYNSDTIRIYNAHLESMRINSSGLEDLDGVRENYRQTLGKLHRGSLERSKQLNVLVEHFQNSPHPVILMGDLNEVPYSYTYFKLSETMENAFEKAGNGFGFTYNKVLFFLRIDHIFSTKEFEAVAFKTHREVDYSDHYPISATFTFK
ncbi:endonuclease/exonuclease/phosphatase family metal-dependent hydrolase [Algoriphagus iocasae]|uniref:Endonuclease/exonuclease/phosphatase family metal-dependent hydrolase n=1 Tax=Algoriphagus iocasae TaxID=1836499 RepID=A0A841MQC5_9BACT|nr:endonuclease/exonuclease/phosphatase family protein [Algoriphagus iocasae]MBB6327727.1 endonuclease/exonuclease/phosphatase family metal-dependent hydrolase [Algoriphagus iocasae]